MLKQPKTLLTAAIALSVGLAACTTNPQTGQSQMSKTAMYGLGAAAACGIAGAATHGRKGARNAALGCGIVGAGVGGYMDYQEKQLRDKLANTQVGVDRVGDQIKLTMPDNITFAVNSADLQPAVRTALSDVANVLTQYPDTTITVAGHTDNTGNPTYNQSLSQRRAQSVAGFLQSRGVAGSRVNPVGYGQNQPIASNTTVEGRAKNRRVEILINPKSA